MGATWPIRLNNPCSAATRAIGLFYHYRSYLFRFLARDVIYTFRAYAIRCQCPSVCPSVRLSVTEVHWRIIHVAVRFQIPIPIYRTLRSRCMRARRKGSYPGKVEGSSRAMLATARPSCNETDRLVRIKGRRYIGSFRLSI